MTAKSGSPGGAVTVLPEYARRGPGRPSAFTWDIANEICERLAQGELLVAICSEPHMPPIGTVYSWDRRDRAGEPGPHKGFALPYAEAREAQGETLAERAMWRAMEPQRGVVTTRKQVVTKSGALVDVEEVREGDAVEARRLEVDTLKWAAKHLAPGRYSERIAELKAREAGGGADDGTTRIVVEGGLPDDGPGS